MNYPSNTFRAPTPAPKLKRQQKNSVSSYSASPSNFLGHKSTARQQAQAPPMDKESQLEPTVTPPWANFGSAPANDSFQQQAYPSALFGTVPSIWQNNNLFQPQKNFSMFSPNSPYIWPDGYIPPPPPPPTPHTPKVKAKSIFSGVVTSEAEPTEVNPEVSSLVELMMDCDLKNDKHEGKNQKSKSSVERALDFIEKETAKNQETSSVMSSPKIRTWVERVKMQAKAESVVEDEVVFWKPKTASDNEKTETGTGTGTRTKMSKSEKVRQPLAPSKQSSNNNISNYHKYNVCSNVKESKNNIVNSPKLSGKGEPISVRRKQEIVLPDPLPTFFGNANEDPNTIVIGLPTTTKYADQLIQERVQMLKQVANSGYGVVPITNSFTNRNAHTKTIEKKAIDRAVPSSLELTPPSSPETNENEILENFITCNPKQSAKNVDPPSPSLPSEEELRNNNLILFQVGFANGRQGIFQGLDTSRNGEPLSNLLNEYVVLNQDDGYDIGILRAFEPLDTLVPRIPEVPFMRVIRRARSKELAMLETKAREEAFMTEAANTLLSHRPSLVHMKVQYCELQSDKNKLIVFADFFQYVKFNEFVKSLHSACEADFGYQARIFIQRRFVGHTEKGENND